MLLCGSDLGPDESSLIYANLLDFYKNCSISIYLDIEKIKNRKMMSLSI